MKSSRISYIPFGNAIMLTWEGSMGRCSPTKMLWKMFAHVQGVGKHGVPLQSLRSLSYCRRRAWNVASFMSETSWKKPLLSSELGWPSSQHSQLTRPVKAPKRSPRTLRSPRILKKVLPRILKKAPVIVASYPLAVTSHSNQVSR